MSKEFIFMEEWMKTRYNTRIFGPTDLIHLSPFPRYGYLKMSFHVKSNFLCKKWFVTLNISPPNFNGA